MPESFALSVPFFTQLKDPNRWVRSAEDERCFDVVRLHFYCSGLPTGGLKRGEQLREITIPSGGQRKIETIDEYEYEAVVAKKSFAELLHSEAAIRSFATKLGAGASFAPAAQVSLAGELTDELRTKFRASAEQREVERKRVKRTEKEALTITGAANEKFFIACNYRLHSYDLYLVLADYLRVEYRKSGMLRRAKRYKVPTHPSGTAEQRFISTKSWKRSGPNLLWFNSPLCSIGYWERVDKSHPVVSEADYVNEVPNPFRWDVAPIANPQKRQFPTEDCPSLYALAETAFSHRWPPERLNAAGSA